MADTEKQKLRAVEQSLNRIAEFLGPCLPLANAHATDFITKDHWNNLIPARIRDELLQLRHDQLRNLPINVLNLDSDTNFIKQDRPKTDPNNPNKESMIGDIISKSEKTVPNIDQDEECGTLNILENPDLGPETAKSVTVNNQQTYNACSAGMQLPYLYLSDFTKAAKLCSVDSLGMAISPQYLMSRLGRHGDKDVFVGTFMNQKKCHEVEIMSKICASLSKHFDCKLVVDFGSGKGYLGNHLSLQQGLSVLGIDAAITNTESAIKRNTILDKQWDSLARNKELESQGTKLTKKEKKKIKVQRDMKAKGSLSVSEVNDIGKDKPVNVVASEKQFKDKGVSENHIKSDEILSIDQLSVSESKANRFVPCTTFIDAKTNFINLAKDHFPELFKSFSSDNNSGIDNTAEGEDNDFTDSVKTDSRNDGSAKMQEQSANQYTKGQMFVKSDGKKTVLENDTNIFEPVFEENVSNNVKEAKSKQEMTRENSDNLNILLTGLHTCGNLASTSIDMFVRSNQLKVLCNVGCCYHLLTEKYLDTQQDSDISHQGFPLSKCLTQKKFHLGNTARNLAAQSIHRISDFDKFQGERFYPRALLEVLIHDVCGADGVQMKGLRKLEQKCSSTLEYIQKACKKLDISEKVTDKMIVSYIEKYSQDRHRLAAFFQLKTILAPCIESLIILDRVCFLLEQENVTDVYLVKMFDPQVSPRCYGIVAVK